MVKHIPHPYSSEVASKSEVAVLDVLHKNETKSADMVDIMREQQTYLGEGYTHTVLSGGDHITCERQQGSKRHVMDSDTRIGRLELLEPCAKDWHCLLSVLGVCLSTKNMNMYTHVLLYSLHVPTCTRVDHMEESVQR